MEGQEWGRICISAPGPNEFVLHLVTAGQLTVLTYTGGILEVSLFLSMSCSAYRLELGSGLIKFTI